MFVELMCARFILYRCTHSHLGADRFNNKQTNNNFPLFLWLWGSGSQIAAAYEKAERHTGYDINVLSSQDSNQWPASFRLHLVGCCSIQRYVKDGKNILLKNEYFLFSFMWLGPEKVAEKYKTNSIQDFIDSTYKILYIKDAAVTLSGCFKIWCCH